MPNKVAHSIPQPDIIKHMKFQKSYVYFANREGRAQFIADTFGEEIEKSKKILDVGSDYNTLKKIVGNKVLGVDLYGEPDIIIDFEKEKLSRFKDGQFDMVVCTEVLEHLDNLHEMADELCRVSNRYVLVSLPNCMSLFAKLNILFNSRVNKFYDLTFEKPEDRHRWFFNYRDIDRFFEHLAKKNGYRVKRKFLECGFTDSLKGRTMRFMVKVFNIDSASRSYWILLEKKGKR